MKTLIILITIGISLQTQAKNVVMCNRLEILGYVNHAKISNSSDFKISSRGKYDIEIFTHSNKDGVSTTLIIETSGQKMYEITNDCKSENIEDSIDLES